MTRRARKLSTSSQNETKNEMHHFKKCTAHSGSKHHKVKSRKQAIAIDRTWRTTS